MPTNKIKIDNLSTTANSITTTILGDSATRATNTFSSICPILYGNGTFLVPITSNNSPYTHRISVYSIDKGVTWVTNTTALPVAAIWSYVVTFGNGKFVYIEGEAGTAGNKTAYSSDGINWSSGSTLSSSLLWNSIACDNAGKFICTARGSSFKATSTDGINWTVSGLSFTPNYGNLCWGNGIWIYANSSGTIASWTSTDGTTWTARTPPGLVSGLVFYNGLFFICCGSTSYVSSDAVNWTNISSQLPSGGWSSLSFAYYKGLFIAYVNISGYMYIFTSSDGYNWGKYSNTTNLLPGASVTFVSGDQDANDYMLYFARNAGTTYGYGVKLVPSILGANGLSYVDVKATHILGTSPPVTKRLYVKKGQMQAPIYSIAAWPGNIQLASTADGVVNASAYATATSLITIFKNGVEQTGWTINQPTNDTGLTASVTTATLSVTALTQAVDSAYATIVATKQGEPDQTIKILVSKNRSTGVSGITPGTTFSAFTTTQTSAYIKFLTTGFFQIKYGTGSYVNAGTWYGPTNSVSPQGGSYWIKMEYTGETLVAISPSALNTWQNMNVDREYSFTNAVPGVHVCNLKVSFSLNSSGDPSVMGTGTLRLQV